MTQYIAATAASITSLARRIMDTNLCKEIVFEGAYYAPYFPKTLAAFDRLPVNKYKFSRAKWYVADFDWVRQGEVLEWCRQQFGPHPKNPDAWSRWCQKYQEKIHFRDEKDYLMFLLKWS